MNVRPTPPIMDPEAERHMTLAERKIRPLEKEHHEGQPNYDWYKTTVQCNTGERLEESVDTFFVRPVQKDPDTEQVISKTANLER